MNHRLTGTMRSFATLCVAALAVAAVACGDFTSVPAQLATLTDSGTVYAINGAPPGAPTALHLYSASRLAADAQFFFDVAFDIDAQGNPVYLPQRAVASALATTHSVSLQSVSTEFFALDHAPKNGYRADTALVARTGQTVVIESQDPNACGISITGTTIHAKIAVTSIDTKLRQLTIRYTIDPNCGFLSFAAGIPKD